MTRITKRGERRDRPSGQRWATDEGGTKPQKTTDDRATQRTELSIRCVRTRTVKTAGSTRRQQRYIAFTITNVKGRLDGTAALLFIECSFDMSMHLEQQNNEKGKTEDYKHPNLTCQGMGNSSELYVESKLLVRRSYLPGASEKTAPGKNHLVLEVLKETRPSLLL